MIEIERKFLVQLSKLPVQGNGMQLRQAYLVSAPGRTVRIRETDGDYMLTIKIHKSGFTRHEFEVPVPEAEGTAMFKAPIIGSVVEKTRYLIPFGNHTWEVDIFKGANKGLVLAEIELSNEGEPFERPNWLGIEVTGDPRFSNANLAESSFKSWGIKYKDIIA